MGRSGLLRKQLARHTQRTQEVHRCLPHLGFYPLSIFRSDRRCAVGNGLPSLPFFTSDFLTAVAAWPTERVGAYCLALFYQWEHGFVPCDDSTALGFIIHASPARARKLWIEIADKFQVEHGEARNVRLEEHRIETQAKVNKNKDRSSKGARAMWHKRRLMAAQAHAQAMPKHVPEHSPSNANHNHSHNQSTFGANTPTPHASRSARVVPEGFAEFWQVYPRRTNRAKAEKAWLSLAPDASLRQQIMAAVAWQRQTAGWQKDGGQFVPHAATWIHNRRWEDEPERVSPFSVSGKTAGNLAALQAFVAGGRS